MNGTHEYAHATRVLINLEHVTHNMSLLQDHVGKRPLWPAIKANGYGHGAGIIGRHLVALGYRTLCVAHVSEAIELRESGIDARFIILSPAPPDRSDYFVSHDGEPVVCTIDMVQSLSRSAVRMGKIIPIHLKVDTGMGRVGIRPDEVVEFLDQCRACPGIHVKGIMSHFPRADEDDKDFSLQQIDLFNRVREASQGYGISHYHFANSAAIFDLPDAYYDAARPGISIYGLRPSATIRNPRVGELKPVLEWKTQITYLKEVPAGTGLSYGHIFHTKGPSLIASIPLGYGDGMSRLLSNRIDLLVGGTRCPQVGRICMDQCLVDVTALRGRVNIGDDVVIIGRQGDEEITADELAGRLGTINYEIVTGISRRVPRIVAS